MTSEVKAPFQPQHSDEDSALYQVTSLINNLNAEQASQRISSIDSLQAISAALGPDRTRNELMPFIADLLEDEETVLIRLALQLGDMLDCVGGPQHAAELLEVLEKICALDELSVREQATESIKKILSSLKLS
jgi:serine/threonine-protein phosphatase 2A regulatory subunit A